MWARGGLFQKVSWPGKSGASKGTWEEEAARCRQVVDRAWPRGRSVSGPRAGRVPRKEMVCNLGPRGPHVGLDLL